MFGDGRLRRIEGRAEHGHSRCMRQLSGQERLARRSAYGRITVVCREASALGRETVEVWRFGFAVAIAAHDVSSVIVGDEEEEVWSAAGLGFAGGCPTEGSRGADNRMRIHFIQRLALFASHNAGHHAIRSGCG